MSSGPCPPRGTWSSTAGTCLSSNDRGRPTRRSETSSHRVGTMERSGGLQEGAKRRGWRPWAFGIALILVIIIVAQNSQKVPVDILFIHTTMPLIIALLIAAVL